MDVEINNKNNYLVEILLVAYNSEKTIKSSLFSIFNQTFTNWKLVVINDGSYDKTLEVIYDTCKLISKEKFEVISFDKNLGLSIRLAEFKPNPNSLFLARIDADDIWMPHKLHYQLSVLLKDNTILALGSSAITQIENNKFNIGKINCYSNPLINRFILPFKNTFVHSSLIFKTSSFISVHGYSSRYKYSQDYFLLLKISSIGKVLSIKEPLVILSKSKKQNFF
jgi:Glycosyltransferases involved in cell wall biogenesis